MIVVPKAYSVTNKEHTLLEPVKHMDVSKIKSRVESR